MTMELTSYNSDREIFAQPYPANAIPPAPALPDQARIADERACDHRHLTLFGRGDVEPGGRIDRCWARRGDTLLQRRRGALRCVPAASGQGGRVADMHVTPLPGWRCYRCGRCRYQREVFGCAVAADCCAHCGAPWQSVS